VTTLAGHGITAQLPRGWEGSIHLRDPLPGESTHPVLHVGSFPLPAPSRRGDFGSGAVERMTMFDAFVVLLEYHPSSAGTALFARHGLPTKLDPDSLDPATLQRQIKGHAGTQAFFNQQGRAFCLYVVVGSYRNRVRLVRGVNTVLEGIGISPL
jgi:hypothetical protein